MLLDLDSEAPQAMTCSDPHPKEVPVTKPKDPALLKRKKHTPPIDQKAETSEIIHPDAGHFRVVDGFAEIRLAAQVSFPLLLSAVMAGSPTWVDEDLSVVLAGPHGEVVWHAPEYSVDLSDEADQATLTFVVQARHRLLEGARINRIEVRRGPLTLSILDLGGEPLPALSVRVRLGVT